MIATLLLPAGLDVLTPQGALVPVERKKARAPVRPYEGDLIQAVAYCLLVEDTYGQTPRVMRIQYADRCFDEPFTPRHREWVVQVRRRLRAARRTTPCNRSHGIVAKCRHCSQRMNCGQAL